jgi:hypothetical protein
MLGTPNRLATGPHLLPIGLLGGVLGGFDSGLVLVGLVRCARFF